MTRTERTYYLITCLYRVAWSALGPTYALFLLDRGLDVLQINIVLATYLITTCLLEVPTGAVADVCGRKASFLLSCVVRASAFGLYYCSSSFGQFIVAEMIDALGTTLATGAFDAWAIDGIHAEGDHRPVDRLFARAQMLAQSMAIVGGLGAAYLADRDLSLPWLVGMAGFLFCGLAGALLMRDHDSEKQKAEGGKAPSAFPFPPSAFIQVGRTMRDSLAAVREMPVMLGLCLLTMGSAFAAVPTYQTWQPRLQGLAGQGPWLMGWVWALLNLASIAGSLLIPVLVGRCGRPGALFAARLWRALTLGVAGAAATFNPAVTGFLMQEIGNGVSEPLLQAWMNEHADAERRATILSLRSLSFTLGGAAGLVCLGLVARGYGIGTAWLLSAGIFVLIAPGFLVLGRLARRSPHIAPALTAANS